MAVEHRLTSLSVFFPCYNEEKNLRTLIKEYLAVLPQIAKRYEIIIVNDGSSDKTAQAAQKLSQEFSHIRVVEHESNQGYGAAVRTGIASSTMDWVFFSDGDNQFFAEDLHALAPHAQPNTAVIGYRAHRAEGFRRRLNAYLYKVFIDILFRLHVRDIDCAFKLLPGETIRSLTLQSNGAFLSSEMLIRLKKKRIRFVQIPVRHRERKHGTPTGSNLRVIIRALREAVRFYIQEHKKKVQRLVGSLARTS